MKIYFAGSINGGREKKEAYFDLIQYCSQFGVVLTEHVGNADVTVENEKKYSDKPDEHVYIRDVKWLDECDIVVAEVSVPSLGVGYEIGYAEAHNKDIVCLYDIHSEKNLSYMLSGNNKNKIIKYDTLDDVKEALEKYFKEYNK